VRLFGETLLEQNPSLPQSLHTVQLVLTGNRIYLLSGSGDNVTGWRRELDLNRRGPSFWQATDRLASTFKRMVTS